MKTMTVNISFPRELLKTVDAVARAEARTRSELLREAARLYAERRARWEQIFAFGDRQREALGLQPHDVDQAIRAYRRRAARSAA